MCVWEIVAFCPQNSSPVTLPLQKKSECSKKALGGVGLNGERRGFWVHGNGEKNQKVTAVATLACNWASKRASKKKGLMQKNLFWVPPPKKVTLQAKKKGALFHFRSWFLEK